MCTVDPFLISIMLNELMRGARQTSLYYVLPKPPATAPDLCCGGTRGVMRVGPVPAAAAAAAHRPAFCCFTGMSHNALE